MSAMKHPQQQYGFCCMCLQARKLLTFAFMYKIHDETDARQTACHYIITNSKMMKTQEPCEQKRCE